MNPINWREHITSNPEVLYGKPVVKGTRIPVDLILEKLAHGNSIEQLMKAYPKITANDINACLLFASEYIKGETIFNAA